LLPNSKTKVLNVLHLKKFFSENSDSQNDSDSEQKIPENLDVEPNIFFSES